MSINAALRTVLLFALPLALRAEPPVIITQPGPEFQDGRRPGAMIIGMDRTPKGGLWGCGAAGGPGLSGLTDRPRK